MDSLFAPIAERIRPQCIDDFVGQGHLMGEGKVLRRLLLADNIPSMIFWGPPGSGKTSLARVIAKSTKAEFITFSATNSSISEVKKTMEEAMVMQQWGKKTIVFIDEVHRFNKSQQDAFLPYVEQGAIVLIGATTENPSFEVRSALLSRVKVFVLYALTRDEVHGLLSKALSVFAADNHVHVSIAPPLLSALADFANGDARLALNILEIALNSADNNDNTIEINAELLSQCMGKPINLYDKDGEEHYNLISALHKSMRNSDIDAALYWLCRMLDSGEEPLYIARRIIRFASEDIGLADNRALGVAIDAYNACHYIGMPECGLALAQAAAFCARAPKSNAIYKAYAAAMADARARALPVPLHLRNSPTALMQELGYGKGYKYAHDYENKKAEMDCMPQELLGKKYFY